MVAYTQETIRESIAGALKTLFDKDSLILTEQYDIHERTVTHRLAIYLEKYFADYDVDIEYNRMLNKDNELVNLEYAIPKRLSYSIDKKDSSVYPDIIVHKRCTNDNLLVMEVKMQWKNQGREKDYEKINAYMNELNYNYGVYLEIGPFPDCNYIIEFGGF